MRTLYYKFVTRQNWVDNYQAQYPKAPSSLDGSEYLICGEGQLNENQMLAYKAQSNIWHEQPGVSVVEG